MPVVINGSGTVTGITGITGTNATVTGITSVASNAANTPVIMQDSGSNSNTLRAWVRYNGATGSINGSFNVSSVTVNSTGYFTITFTTAMANANYSIVGSLSATSGTGQSNTFQPFTNPSTGGTVAPTTSSFVCSSMNGGGTSPVYVCIAIFGA